MKVVIIGAGLAGLAASDALAAAGREVEVFEANPYWGGRIHSVSEGGFVFDEGPHVSFTTDKNVQDVFTRGAGEVEEFSARITNAFRGHWITHPAQCHLYGLDLGLVTDCIADFVSAQQNPPEMITYADWCYAMFGKTFSENFAFAYTRKYWTREAADLSTDWVEVRMYPPKLKEVIRGALEPEQKGNFHYLTRFRYPTKGGYQSFLRAMVRPDLIRLEKRVSRLDIRGKRIFFNDGTFSPYDRLISTMALPSLIGVISPEQVPREVQLAAEKLSCSSLVLVDVAVNRRDLFHHHWFYVYDEEISFARGHFPHMLSPCNAPEGQGSIQLEIYHSPFRPLPCESSNLPGRVGEELVKLKILASEREILWIRHRDIQYANVIFDENRAGALSVIYPWVKSHDIFLAGRYGEWGYLWSDDATRSGWKAAAQIINPDVA
jgi:protoporphyrinogen oxidase